MTARLAPFIAASISAAGCAAAKYPLDPRVREALRGGPPVEVVHDAPRPLKAIDQPFDTPPDLSWSRAGLDAPIVEATEIFTEALRVGLQLGRWTEPGPGSSADERPEPGRAGLRIVLNTEQWVLDGTGFKRLSAGCDVRWAMSATLRRSSDRGVLWQDGCVAVEARQCAALERQDWRVLKEVRGSLARRCATELAASFTGHGDGPPGGTRARPGGPRTGHAPGADAVELAVSRPEDADGGRALALAKRIFPSEVSAALLSWAAAWYPEVTGWSLVGLSIVDPLFHSPGESVAAPMVMDQTKAGAAAFRLGTAGVGLMDALVLGSSRISKPERFWISMAALHTAVLVTALVERAATPALPTEGERSAGIGVGLGRGGATLFVGGRF